ncbi:M1-specific T cell receptor beta chain-like [Acanthochromis polyacanthus]|uniref:M1-specific T cell receptor beta chain-like n=1 Tax=Acanthochromis polyacanthus TaxID=80966 RepID=UPI0022340583|nr:M1-specific T cell receptor beta chain-like [Acanthochromis polyacanthus]
MIVFFLCITLNSVLVSGSSLSDKVDQTPADIYKEQGQTAIIYCSHKIDNYDKILWYKQLNGQLQYLGYLNVNTGYPEDGLNVTIEGDGNKDKNSTLTIKSLSESSSAVYFCAANYHSYEAYFGQGTKLTVLGDEVKPPTVTIFPPSPNECRNQKDKKLRKKTLVCVASGFYPDHVGVVWKINGNEAKDGVATDSAATRVDKFYRITSRLRVPAKDYHTASNTFTCIVNFYDGNDTIPYDNSTYGIEGKAEGGITREKYLKVTQGAKLSYVVVIIKSCFYGVFVAFLVWKLQGSARKHH